jgi:hypothetical protein
MDGSFCLGYDYGLSLGGVTAFRTAKFSLEHVLVVGRLIRRLAALLIHNQI